jgi:hypothetical protein
MAHTPGNGGERWWIHGRDPVRMKHAVLTRSDGPAARNRLPKVFLVCQAAEPGPGSPPGVLGQLHQIGLHLAERNALRPGPFGDPVGLRLWSPGASSQLASSWRALNSLSRRSPVSSLAAFAVDQRLATKRVRPAVALVLQAYIENAPAGYARPCIRTSVRRTESNADACEAAIPRMAIAPLSGPRSPAPNCRVPWWRAASSPPPGRDGLRSRHRPGSRSARSIDYSVA